MVIPKIIHQTYKEKNHKYLRFSEEWQKYNPKWEYIFYNDNDIKSFFNKYEKDINKDFNNLFSFLKECSIIEKIDIFRYLIMYYIGGIYCDIDTNCFKSFDKLCQNKDCILGIESYITHHKKMKLDYKFNYSIGNAILISKKKHPIFKLFITNILEKKYTNNIDKIFSEYTVQKTGPGIITKTIQNMIYSKDSNNWNIRNIKYEKNNIEILEQIFFYPPSNPPIYNIYPFNINIYSNHVCEGSWKQNKNNKFSTMDFLPYPWIWMYNFRIDYIMSIISMIPVLQTSNILYQKYKIQSILMFFTFLSAFAYHTNEYIGNKRYEILHRLDNVMAYNTIPLIYFLKLFKNNNVYMDISSISITAITFIFQYYFYSQTIVEIIQVSPFIYFLKNYLIQYNILSFFTIVFFILGSQEFDYFSSRKYHTLWHLCGSLLIYKITLDIID